MIGDNVDIGIPRALERRNISMGIQSEIRYGHHLQYEPASDVRVKCIPLDASSHEVSIDHHGLYRALYCIL